MNRRDLMRLRILAWRRDRGRPLPAWARGALRLLDRLARLRG